MALNGDIPERGLNMNLPMMGIRTAPHKYGEKTMGIHLSRFGASWIRSGGNINDRDGFLIWMMNIPFENADGTIEYISQDDAEDAYFMMECGKFELEKSARRFLKSHKRTKKVM